MLTFVAAFVTHALRVGLAALTMLAVAVVLWLVVGVATAVLGLQTPSLILIFAVTIAFVALLSGGYISAKRITPRSMLHPAIAGAALGLLYIAIFTSGLWSFSIGVVVAAAGAALIGALVARFGNTPPNKSLERTREG